VSFSTTEVWGKFYIFSQLDHSTKEHPK